MSCMLVGGLVEHLWLQVKGYRSTSGNLRGKMLQGFWKPVKPEYRARSPRYQYFVSPFFSPCVYFLFLSLSILTAINSQVYPDIISYHLAPKFMYQYPPHEKTIGGVRMAEWSKAPDSKDYWTVSYSIPYYRRKGSGFRSDIYPEVYKEQGQVTFSKQGGSPPLWGRGQFEHMAWKFLLNGLGTAQSITGNIRLDACKNFMFFTKYICLYSTNALIWLFCSIILLLLIHMTASACFSIHLKIKNRRSLEWSSSIQIGD